MNISRPMRVRPLPLYSGLLVVGILCLIFLGALVKSHEAGLSVPDWPATYGHNMFLFPYSQWIGGIFYEHSHRLLASGIGLATLILGVWLWCAPVSRRLQWAGTGACALVVLQGVLGGLTVVYGLPDVVSVLHGVIAQTFLLVIVGLSFFVAYRPTRPAPATATNTLGVVTLGVVYVQLICGAVMRHAEAGLAVLDFPTMAGSFLPSVGTSALETINVRRGMLNMAPVDTYQVTTHLVHRFWALAVFIVVVAYVVRLLRHYRRIGSLHQRRWVLALAGCLLVQIVLGIYTVLSLRQPWITSVHVVVGALMLALCFWNVLLWKYRGAFEELP